MTPTTTQNPTNPFDKQTAASKGEAVRERVSQVTSHVKNTAADLGRSAAENIDRNLDTAAGALEKTASSLRSRVGEGGTRMTDVAKTAADKLEGTARYFREHHSREMVSDFEGLVKRNPGTSLMAALGLGLLIGMSMTGKRNRY
jgi:ElaB/YqjD/DUF883 family membrane-anchored ribosome-binding protein